MDAVLSCIKWVCLTIIVHDVVSNISRILNTLFVERIRAQIEELQIRRVEAQAFIIAEREARRDHIVKKWRDSDV